MEHFNSQNRDQSFLVKEGNERLLLIIVGSGGALCGYNDKYGKIAEMINDICGASVIISENPRRLEVSPVSYNFDTMMDFAERYMEKRHEAYETYFMGVFLGSSYGLMCAHRHDHIARVFSVNAPFMINTHKLLEGIHRFTGKRLSLVYGDQDPSYKLMPFIRQLESPTCQVAEVMGADRNFFGMEDAFIALPGTRSCDEGNRR